MRRIRGRFLSLKSGQSRKKTLKSFTPKHKIGTYKLALWALGILLGIILLSKLISLLDSFYKPINQGLQSQKQYFWDGKTSINIVVKAEAISLLNYDPNTQKIIILNIPNETYIDLPKGFGSWRIGSVYDLGQEESKPMGASLLKQSFVKLLGIPVDGFIGIQDGLKKEKISDVVLMLHNNPIKWWKFYNQIDSDMTPLEVLRLIWNLSYVREDKIVFLDLAQSSITESKLLPDSSRVLGVDKINLDLYIRSKMADSKIVAESVSVGIFNATGYSGLAQEVARMVTNLGGDVIITSNTESHLDQTQIFTDGKSDTFNRLGVIFAPWCLNKACFVNDPKVLSSRAQINIVLGEDYYKSNYQR